MGTIDNNEEVLKEEAIDNNEKLVDEEIVEISDKRQVKMTYEITQKDWLEVNKLFYKIYGKKRKIALWAISAFVYAMFALQLFTAANAYLNNKAAFEAAGGTSKMFTNVGLMLFVVIWISYLNYSDDKKGVKKSYRFNKARFKPSELVLNEEGAVSTRDGSSSEYKWTDVENVFVFNKYILVMFSRSQGFFLNKDNISKEDQDTVLSILRDNSSAEIQFFNK